MYLNWTDQNTGLTLCIYFVYTFERLERLCTYLNAHGALTISNRIHNTVLLKWCACSVKNYKERRGRSLKNVHKNMKSSHSFFDLIILVRNLFGCLRLSFFAYSKEWICYLSNSISKYRWKYKIAIFILRLWLNYCVIVHLS